MPDLYSTHYNPDVLSSLANLSNDEVFTPPQIANAMLDLLPQGSVSGPQHQVSGPGGQDRRLSAGDRQAPDRGSGGPDSRSSGAAGSHLP